MDVFPLDIEKPHEFFFRHIRTQGFGTLRAVSLHTTGSHRPMLVWTGSLYQHGVSNKFHLLVQVFKGTVARDFPPPFLFFKSTHLEPWFFQIWFQIRGVIPIEVWLPAALCRGEWNLATAFCSGKSNLPTAFCSGEMWLPTASWIRSYCCNMQRRVKSCRCMRQREVKSYRCIMQRRVKSYRRMMQQGVKSKNFVRLPRPFKGPSLSYSYENHVLKVS